MKFITSFQAIVTPGECGWGRKKRYRRKIKKRLGVNGVKERLCNKVTCLNSELRDLKKQLIKAESDNKKLHMKIEAAAVTRWVCRAGFKARRARQ